MPDRRQFLQSALATAAIGISGRIVSSTGSAPRLRVASLYVPGFPGVDAPRIHGVGPALDEELTVIGMNDLGRLTPDRFDVFVTSYGSAFPKDAWPALLAYLRAGGNWVNLGGVPCAVPVVWDAGAWRAEARTTEYHRRLGFTLGCAVDAGSVKAWRANEALPWTSGLLGHFRARTVWELYYRLSSVADTPGESGSAGPMEAVVQPLVTGYDGDRRAVAAPFVMLDWLGGEFAGGRWVFATLDGSLDEPLVLRALQDAASLGMRHLEVRPSYACYREGERPALAISYRGAPRAAAPSLEAGCRVGVFDARGRALARLDVPVRGSGAEAKADGVDLGGALPARLDPGLYRVEATLTVPGERPFEMRATTGFWVWDDALLAAGTPLVAGQHGFTRSGEPYPVTGTTYMASDVHRKFLLLPNPWLWDRDFAEMKRAGVNLVRTGIWTGWKVLMPRSGEFREDALRALDAWLLTARRYDIPVIFTLFAFLPETWGGENAYLDPAAVEAQQAFVSAIASRYARMNDLLWDLINEPSFCNAAHLWSCRPNGDRFERAAWEAWLAGRYPSAADRDGLELPSLDDFKPGSGGADRRVREYRLFAQATFPRWVAEMREALRASGNPRQLVTVGQDEAGTNDSPNNLFAVADSVDFTCLHNWWLNDALVWDNVMTTAPGKMNLVEETGVMFSGRPAGIEPGWEQYARNLLERKMALSVAQTAGFVEWVWNSNCYMPSDNEAAIGLLRADGTAKPELEPLIGIARFAAEARRHLVGREVEPVLLVVPHADMFGTRNTATDATKAAVRALVYGCRVGVSAISEYALAPAQPAPRVAVVPGAISVLEAREVLAAWSRSGTAVVEGPADEALYRRTLEAAGIRPPFSVTGADASVLVYAAVFRDAELYVFASETGRETQLRVTPAGSGRPFDVRLAPGRAALVLAGRRDGRILARYPGP